MNSYRIRKSIFCSIIYNNGEIWQELICSQNNLFWKAHQSPMLLLDPIISALLQYAFGYKGHAWDTLR